MSARVRRATMRIVDAFSAPSPLSLPSLAMVICLILVTKPSASSYLVTFVFSHHRSRWPNLLLRFQAITSPASCRQIRIWALIGGATLPLCRRYFHPTASAPILGSETRIFQHLTLAQTFSALKQNSLSLTKPLKACTTELGC